MIMLALIKCVPLQENYPEIIMDVFRGIFNCYVKQINNICQYFIMAVAKGKERHGDYTILKHGW